MSKIQGNDIVLGNGDNKQPIRLSAQQRSQHLYVVGGTGMGKSRLLTSLIQQDIDQWRKSGCGLMLIDLHGELYQQVMGWLSSRQHVHLERPIVPINMTRPDYVVGYNLLRQRQGPLAATIKSVVDAIAHAQGQDGAQETPRFSRLAGAALYALAAHGMTIAEVLDVLGPENKLLRERLAQGMPRWVASSLLDLNAMPPKDVVGFVESTLNRVNHFLSNPHIERMVSQTGESFDFLTAMEKGAIVLVNLATKGNEISQSDASTLATVFLSDVWMAARERGKEKEQGRPPKPFYLYLDEFQNFITPTIASSLNEARGFGLHLTLAHQFPSQLTDSGERGRRLWGSVRSNTSTKVVMGLSDPDEYSALAKWLFTGEVDAYRVKHDIFTRSVIGENETTRTSITIGESDTETRGGGESVARNTSSGGSASSGTATARSYGEYRDSQEKFSFLEGESVIPPPFRDWQKTETQSDASADNWGESESAADSSSWSASRGTSRSETVAPYVEREWAEQHTSRTYQGVDEQLFELGQKIFRLGKIQAITRVAGASTTQTMTSLHVPDIYASQETQENYRLECLKQWRFVLPQDEADAAIEGRRKWAEKLIAPPQEEPQEFTNRRRMKTREE